jgi:aryl-alcohol dehydrogenase-like predicted oxidoreductase
MAELVAEGKVRYLGLSEVTSDLLRRAPDHRGAERVLAVDP